MDPNRKAVVDFEVEELQLKLSNLITDFVAGQEVDKSKAVLIQTKKIEEHRYRIARANDVLINLIVHLMATARMNGAVYPEHSFTALVQLMRDESDKAYEDMKAQKYEAIEEVRSH